MPYILARKYLLLKTIGKGASSSVKLAIEQETGTHVAIKIMNSSVDESLKELFVNEVTAMDDLKHENIIRQIEHGTAEIVHCVD